MISCTNPTTKSPFRHQQASVCPAAWDAVNAWIMGDEGGFGSVPWDCESPLQPWILTIHSAMSRIWLRCSKYKKEHGSCKGKIMFSAQHMGIISVAAHSCELPTVYPVEDATEKMKEFIDTMSVEKPSVPAGMIWDAVRKGFYLTETEAAVRGLSGPQVSSRVYRARNKHYNGNIHGKIERPQLSLTADNTSSFFQFHLVTPNKANVAEPHRIVGWGHPLLIRLLSYAKTNIFVDGTFRCVPRGFKQCVILLVMDRACQVFVPVFYALTTGRTEDIYWDTIHSIIQATEQRLEPSQVVCDFEQALLTAVQTQFPEADVVGCLFHWKQAILRNMKRLRISEAEATLAMKHGVLDILTVIEHASIDPSGIVWVKNEMKRSCEAGNIRYSTKKWRMSWKYFRKTWLHRYSPKVWNVQGISKTAVARTNNPPGTLQS